jgi:hypothetical protein
VTTIADNLQIAAQDRGLTIRCTITPFTRNVRIDVENITRIVRVSTASRILSTLRAGMGDPFEIVRSAK